MSSSGRSSPSKRKCTRGGWCSNMAKARPSNRVKGTRVRLRLSPRLKISLKHRGSNRSKGEEEAAAVVGTEVAATVTAEAEAERESISTEEMARVAVVEHVDGETRTLC
jgi:hypothetical protein